MNDWDVVRLNKQSIRRGGLVIDTYQLEGECYFSEVIFLVGSAQQTSGLIIEGRVEKRDSKSENSGGLVW